MENSNATVESVLKRYVAPSSSELVRPLDDGRLECVACGHRCRIREGHQGVCRVRYVERGVLWRPQGYVGAVACDPIEKKPFYHAFPGRDIVTFGMLGCDLRCGYCQNWDTSQVLRDEAALSLPRPVSAAALVEAAVALGVPAIASSYNEPLITADWAVEVFERARAAGLSCAFVSNGNATPEVLAYLRPFVDLYKVDLKGFTQEAYRDLGGRLDTVLDTIRGLKERGFWVEIVTLVVPGLNDSPGELRAMARFLSSIDRDMPWHLTAFHPDYRMTDRERTRLDSLAAAYEIGKEAGLRYVYLGNVAGAVPGHEDTHCPQCDEVLIRRRGFLVLENRMRGRQCPGCETTVPGIWEDRAPPCTVGGGRPRRVPLPTDARRRSGSHGSSRNAGT